MDLISALQNHPEIVQEESLELKETHISRVLVGQKRVFKFKKAVQLDFVDQSSLEKRVQLCLLEYMLNSRLSPEVYLDIQLLHSRTKEGNPEFVSWDELSEDSLEQIRKKHIEANTSWQVHSEKPDSFASNQPYNFLQESRASHIISRCRDRFGEPLDVCVVMQHLPDSHRLQERPGLTSIDMQNLAFHLARFHRSLPEQFPSAGFSSRLDNVMNTLQSLQKLRFKESLDRRIKSETNRLKKRRYHEVDGHGDLRPDHIYIQGEEVSIIDCVEFSPEIRQVDPFEDIAFTTMGLRLDGRSDLARQLALNYLSLLPDVNGFVLLDLYEIYRACVRLMVDRLQLKSAQSDAENPHSQVRRLRARCQQYESLIEDLLTGQQTNHIPASFWPESTIIVLMGLPATGKSLIGRLIRNDGIPVLSSDLIRKSRSEDFNERNPRPFGQGDYSSHRKKRNYQKLVAMGGKLQEKESVICLDASFSKRQYREILLKHCKDSNFQGQILFLETTCDEQTIRNRLDKRKRNRGASDLTDFSTWKKIESGFEPLLLKRADTDRSSEDSGYSNVGCYHIMLDTSGEKRTESIVSEIREGIPEFFQSTSSQ